MFTMLYIRTFSIHCQVEFEKIRDMLFLDSDFNGAAEQASIL